jgi:hypothetical protein
LRKREKCGSGKKDKRREKLNRVQTRFVWVFDMEVVDEFLGVVEFIGRDPGGFFISAFITCPLDKVTKLAAEATIQLSV